MRNLLNMAYLSKIKIIDGASEQQSHTNRWLGIRIHADWCPTESEKIPRLDEIDNLSRLQRQWRLHWNFNSASLRMVLILSGNRNL